MNSKEYYQKHKEKWKEYHKGREKYTKEYRNKPEIKMKQAGYMKEYSKKNKEELKEYKKQYYKKNKERIDKKNMKNYYNNRSEFAKPKFRKDIENRKDEIINLYLNEKNGVMEIAGLMNCDFCVIKRILLENNIKIRPLYFYNTGERSSNWQGGISNEPYDQRFNKQFKKFIKERDGCCMLCNVGFEDLRLLKRQTDVHHVNSNKKLSIPQNCVTLCKRCHGITKKNRQHWIKFFQSLLSERYGYKYAETGEIILSTNN